MNTTAIATKFVKWDVPALETLKETKVYKLREKIIEGKSLTRAEKDWLAERLNNNAYFKSSIPLSGYRFDFSDILKTFVVKQYGTYQKYKAPDKTGLRRFIYGKIDKIIEVK